MPMKEVHEAWNSLNEAERQALFVVYQHEVCARAASTKTASSSAATGIINGHRPRCLLQLLCYQYGLPNPSGLLPCQHIL